MAEIGEKEKGLEKKKISEEKKDSPKSQTAGQFLGEFLYNTNSLMRSTSVIIQEMTLLIPALLVILIGFLGVLTWITFQSGTIPLGLNTQITSMLGVTDLPAAIDVPREFITTFNMFGRSIGGLTISF